jgi:signal transduction histidine kinase
VRGGQGDPLYVIAAVEDLTERMATEERLRQAQKMEAVGQLTGGVAHDFNNLLTVIMGGVEMGMNEKIGPERRARVLNQALQAATRGASLTQRLLAFSRKQALRPKPLDPVQVLEEMQDLLTRTLGETVQVVFQTDGDTGRCLADQAQMEHAILNLSLNARDAMPEGGGLTIRTDRIVVNSNHPPADEAQPGAYVRVSVSDTGTGIPEVHLKKVFEPFFTTKDTGKGSGLGLSQVYGFARQSGGFVTLETEEGVGTSVRFHLPAVDSDGRPYAPAAS